MKLTRSQIGNILITALVSAVLLGIVSSELPKPLSLTDNAANYFTVLKTIKVSPSLPDACRPIRNFEMDPSHPWAALHSSGLNPFGKVAPHSSGFFILYSILRT